jgi:hypothetical protein
MYWKLTKSPIMKYEMKIPACRMIKVTVLYQRRIIVRGNRQNKNEFISSITPTHIITADISENFYTVICKQ